MLPQNTTEPGNVQADPRRPPVRYAQETYLPYWDIDKMASKVSPITEILWFYEISLWIQPIYIFHWTDEE